MLKRIALLFVVLSVLLTSCSIEKRRYQDGYHVEWFKSKKSVNMVSSNEMTGLVETAPNLITDSIVSVEETIAEKPKIEPRSEEALYVSKDEDLLVVEPKKIQWSRDTITPGDDYYAKKQDGKKFNERAYRSKLYGLLSVGSILGSILLNVLMSSMSAAAVLGPLVSILSLVALTLGILAVVMGSKAKKEMAELKGQFVNEDDATIGLVLGWVVVGLYILTAAIFVLALLFLILFFAAI